MTPSEEVFEAVKLWAETLLAQGYSPLSIRTGIEAWIANEKGGIPLPETEDDEQEAATPHPRPRSRLKPGKKTKEWEDCRAKLKPAFEKAGITTCEAQFSGCWRDNALSFAHMDKRRYLSAEELKITALLCTPCHQRVELMRRDQMRTTLQGIIDARPIQPALE